MSRNNGTAQVIHQPVHHFPSSWDAAALPLSPLHFHSSFLLLGFLLPHPISTKCAIAGPNGYRPHSESRGRPNDYRMCFAAQHRVMAQDVCLRHPVTPRTLRARSNHQTKGSTDPGFPMFVLDETLVSPGVISGSVQLRFVTMSIITHCGNSQKKKNFNKNRYNKKNYTLSLNCPERGQERQDFMRSPGLDKSLFKIGDR